jgi:hypothetical protein
VFRREPRGLRLDSCHVLQAGAHSASDDDGQGVKLGHGRIAYRGGWHHVCSFRQARHVSSRDSPVALCAGRHDPQRTDSPVPVPSPQSRSKLASLDPNALSMEYDSPSLVVENAWRLTMCDLQAWLCGCGTSSAAYAVDDSRSPMLDFFRMLHFT